MGNAVSESSPLYTADELKWKSGAVADSIPSQGIEKVTTYENLHATPLFKDYLIKHIDSDYLISSFMSSSDDDAVLLKGIEKFKNLEPEWMDSLQKLVENFELCTSAGINVKESDPLTMCEKQLASGFRSSHAPFLSAFQRRLACMRIMQICIELERKDALATFPTKKSTEPEPNPANQAQLMVLHGLKSAGVSMITMFPMCYRALQESSQQLLLTQPVKLFCEHMCNMTDLELLLPCTQSVTESSDPRILDLCSAAAVNASSGPQSCVYDNNQDTYWSGTHLTVCFHAPHDVASVTLSWVPKYKTHLLDPAASTEVYAPRRVALFARTVDDKGLERPKVKVFCVLPSVERSKQGTWVQTYKVDMLRVKTLKFTLSIKGCDENTSDVSKLFHLDVALADDRACSEIRTLPLLKEVQRALVPLADFADVAKSAYDAQFAVVRSSGSLSLLLALVHSIYTANAERAVQQKSASAVLKLLQVVNSSDYSLRTTYNKLYVSEGSALSDVRFTSSTATFSASGTSATCANKIGAALLNIKLASGTYEWTLTIDHEVTGDESVFLGVVSEACRLLSPEAMFRSHEAYFVRCYNGEIFQGKRCCALPVSAIHRGDACRFVYHSERRTVSLWVNGAPQGVVFDNLAANMRPCVFFQPSAHTRGVSVSNTSLISTILTNGASDKAKLTLREVPTLQGVQCAESVLALLLTEIQHLAAAKAQELQSTSNGALVHAYCAECSVETILLLIALVKRLKSDLDANTSSESTANTIASTIANAITNTTTISSTANTTHIASMIESLLVVLDLQFQCIKLSKIDLRDLGFNSSTTTSTSTDADTASDLHFEPLALTYATTGRFTPHTVTNQHMAAASLVLQELMSCAHAQLSGAAVTAFSHGLSFFLPSTERKIALITDILAQMDVSQDISRIASEPRLKLLQLLMQRFRETGEILAFIDCVARNCEHAAELSSLMTVLLELLVTLQSDAACVYSGESDKSSSTNSSGAGAEFGEVQKAAFAADISALLSTYQQQLVYEILSTTPHAITSSVTGAALTLRQTTLCSTLFLPYVTALLVSSRRFVLATLGADIAQESRRDAVLRESVVGVLVQPLLYALCLPGFDLSFYQDICPELVKMLELLTQYSTASAACGTANALILSTIPRTAGAATSQSGLGWRTIKACFEDSEGTFTTADNSTLYTSVTTSNTAAIVTTKFTCKQKAAWEFLLEADSSGDECSTFGAARGPPTSRCYSSSPDLWMRRAYNGYLYALGSSTGQVMDKVKPGDTVRVEFDGKAGTLSFGLNGSDPEVAFSGITDDVYPACGSYRNGVSIRLMKVEVFDTLDDAAEDEISAVSAFARPSQDIKWVLIEDNFMSTRDNSLLTPAVPKGAKTKVPTVRWVTARADKGALYGVHEYTFELVHANKSPYSVGVVCGTPHPSDRLAGPCLKISSKSSKACEIPGSSLRLTAGDAISPVAAPPASSAPGVTSPPATTVSVDAPNVVRADSLGSPDASLAATARSLSSALAGLTPLQPPPPVTLMPGINLSAAELLPSPTAPPSPTHGRSTPVVELNTSLLTDSSGSMHNNTSRSTSNHVSSSESEGTPHSVPKEQTPELPLSRTYRYPANVLALAWHSDGSLWHNGVKVGDDYGVSVLPLSKSAAISMRVDRMERTVSFTVNGVSLGVAFGPAGSGAKAAVALPRVSPENMSMFPSEHRAVFPASSVSSSAQALRIRATGFRGSTVMPLQMSVQRALTSVLGRVSALLIQGPVVSTTEAAMIPWFASNLMIGGVEEPSAALNSPYSVEESVVDLETMTREIIHGFSVYTALSAGPTKSDVDRVFAWLERIEPEPEFLRKALERSETYRFPACEMPFVACLLKHSGLGGEIVEVLRRSRASEEESPAELPPPSGEMKSMWQRVKQLRVYLRQQRQSLRAIGVAIQSQSAKTAAPAPADPVTPAGTSASLPPRPPRSGLRARLVRQHASRRLDPEESSSTEEEEDEEEEGEENEEDEDGLFFRRNGAHDEHDDREDGEALMDMLSAIQDSLRQTFPEGQLPTPEPVDTETRVDSPVRNPYLRAPVHVEGPDESGGESLIYYTDHIHWTAQPATAVSERSVEESCAVLAVGIDYTNELIYVRLHERFGAADTHKAFQNSRLILNESVGMTAVEVQSEVKVPQERRGCLRFDCSSLATRFFRGLTQTSPTAKSSLKFQFGGSDYSTVDLELPPIFNVIMELTNRGISLGTEADASTAVTDVDVAAEQFAKVCNAIKERAEFLLTLTPAVKALDSTDYRSKTLLHTLTKRYSGNFRPEDLSRWRAQERWKRVVEFLHVQSRSQRDPATVLPAGERATNWDAFRAARLPSTAAPLAKGPSALSRMGSSVLSEQDIQEAEDSGSPVLASMQACAIFMISDGIQATPADLKKIIETRGKRAESRVFGFNTLISILDTISDPLSVSELLVFVRSALKITLPAGISSSDKTLLATASKHHYLNCLEGCSTRTLGRVQDGFVDLYTVLSSLLRRCIAQWENSARSACVRSNDGPYSPSRSFRAMLLKNEEEPDEAVDCDPSNAHILLEPIQSLLELWTLHFSSRDHRWLNRIGIVPSLVKLTSSVFQEEVARTWRDTAERCIEFTKANAAHASAIKAKWEMWSKDFVQQGLRSGTLTMRRVVHYLYNIPESELSPAERAEVGLTDSFAQALDTWSDSFVVSLFHKVLKIVSRKKFIADSEKKQAEAEVEALEAARQQKILDRITPCGTFDPDNKARQVVLTGLNLEAHIADDGGGTAVCAYTTVKYDIAAGPELTGNYFEVTIVNLGRKAIGIGFADRASFRATGYMPGWEPHSYGYHGDDGHKFGSGSTPGDWPLFEVGDVIGCGFDFEARSIFYTRNGALLGTGFTHISDTQLWPVVGFANRSRMREQVKINFGIQPFVHEGDNIVAHPLALAERARAGEAEEVPALDALAVSDENNSLSNTASAKSNTASVLDFSDSPADLVCVSQAEYVQRSREFKAQLAAAEAFSQELAGLRQQGQLVLRFLLTLACNSESDGSACELPTTSSGVNGPSDAPAPPIPVLTKEVSLFGTPKAFTSADGVCLQEGIVSHVVHEFLLSVSYLQAAVEGRRASFDSLQRAQDFPGIDGSLSPGTGGPAGIISAEEASRAVHSHLVLFSSLYDGSKTIQETLHRPALVNALLSITEMPYVGNRNAAFCLLSKILPTMQPETVEDALGSQWLDTVTQFDALLRGSQYRKRMGKMPVSLIQALSLTSSVALSSIPPSQLKTALPYGTGTRALELADLKLILVQRLFESPLWTELVACAVTDSLRNACSAVDKITSRLESSAESEAVQEADMVVLQLACAACVTLNSLGICRTGTRVTVNGDAKGLLLSHCEVSQTATYILERHQRALNLNTHVATAPLAAVEPVVSAVVVDLAELSQPLLQQFFQLAEKVFKWFRAQKTSGSSSPKHTLLCRVASLVSLTLSHLLANQTEVINFVHDSSIIADLLKIALSPSDLSGLPSYKGVMQMWRNTQMRCLELPVTSPVTIAPGAPVSQEISRLLSASGDKDAQAGVVTPSDALNIDETRRADKLHAAQELSSELGSEERLCLLYLDFHMMNVAEARESIVRVKGNAALDPEVMAFFSSAAGHDVTPPATFDDSNLLRKIGDYNPADLLLSASFSASKSASEDRHVQLSLLSTEEYVRRAVEKEDETGEEVILLVRSDLDGRRPAVTGERQYTTAQQLLAAATEAARLRLNTSTSAKSKSTDKSPECFLQTNFLDPSAGYEACDLFDPTNTHKVVSHIGDVPLSQLAAFRSQLDVNLTIQCARSVAARLLLDGSLNMKQDLPQEERWVDLVKLVSSAGNENFEKVVPSLCTGLSMQGGADDSPGSEPNALVAEVTANLRLLANPQSLAAVEPEEDVAALVEFASPHPFPAPTDTTGVIRIPAHWKNVSLQFHPNCSTPSERAVLEFFASEETLAARKPLLSLSGPAKNWVSAQNRSISGPLSSLYYRFSAAPASDRTSFPLVATDGAPAIFNNTCQLPHSDKVGLGEEDSLFNLFDTDPAPANDGTATVECGVDFIPSGAWYYEATVTHDGETGEDQCLVGIISNEFSASDKTMKGSTHACAVHGDGLVTMQTALKYHDSDLGEWKAGDTLGCLFDLSETCVSMWVSKNGVWSPQVTGEVTTAAWKPAVSIAGSYQMSLNWGESRFFFPPPAEIVEQLQGKAYLGVAFYTPQEEDAEVVAEREKLAWGYHFSVRPFVHLRMKLCSEFEMVKKIVVEATSDTPALTLWVWRATTSTGFLAWGDIITTAEYPPMRTVLLDVNQCKPPVELEVVVSSAKAEFAVLRPVAPTGYVSLGDVVIGSTSPSTGQMSTLLKKLVCVPEWAVKSCEVADFVAKFRDCGSGKEISTGSLWSVDNGLGGFFGSPFECRYSHESEGKTKSSTFKYFSVGAGYALVSDTDLTARLTGEWTSEKEVLVSPSLHWTTGLLRSLLQSPSARSQVLTPAIFTQLVQFLRSSAASKPLAAVPLLIQMIRLAQKDKVKLPLDEIKSLCKSILTLAMTFTGSKSTKIPLSLLKLVDFVIEIQIAHIEDTYEKDNFNLFRRFVLHTDTGSKQRSRLSLFPHGTSSAVVESKEEEDGVGGIESKESEPPLLARQSSSDSVALTQHASEEFMHSEILIAADLEELARRVETTQLSGKWWDRVVVPPSLLRLHRGLKLSNIDNIFGKDSTILRLRQVLKFINAVVTSTGGASAFTSTAAQTAVQSTPKDRPYPRFLSSKIWFDLASTSAVEESQHPYRSEPYTRKVHFPGAEKLLVTFDRRCVLAKGDILRVCSFTGLNSGRKNESVVFTHQTTDDIWAKGLSVQGDEVTFVLETTTSADESVYGNPDHAWGWSCVVFASGSIYQRADTVLNLTDLPDVESVDTTLEDPASPKEATDKSGEERKEAEVSPFKAVITGFGASVPAGSTAADFASKTLEELLSATDSELSCAAAAETTTAAEWAKQLVCLRGQLLYSGEVAVPMSHSLRVLFDHVPSVEESAPLATPKVLVVECTPSFASRAGQIKAAGPVFRVCLGSKFERALHTAVRGDTVAYRVFGMTEENLLQILSAVPVATPPATPPAGGTNIASSTKGNDLLVRAVFGADTQQVQQFVENVLIPNSTAAESSAVDADADVAVEASEEEPLTLIEEEDTSEQMWACEVCTLLNAPHLHECAVCSTLRPSSSATGAAGAGAGSTGEGIPGAAASLGWWCTVCTLINSISETTCNACGTARDSTAAPGAAAESAEDGEEEEDAQSEHSSRSGSSASSEEEDVDEEENEEVDEVDSPAELADASPEPDAKRSRGADGKPRPVGDKDASLVSRMSGETKARVLSLKAGDDLIIITLEGKMTEVEEFEARLLGAMASEGAIQTPAQMMCGLSEWSHEADCELIEQMNAVQNTSLPSHQFALSKKFLTYCSATLAAKDLLEVQVRAQHIERFNKHLEHLLSFIDLGSDDPHSLGAMIRKCNRYLLLKIKTPLLETAITSTTVTSGKDCPASLVLDNAKALQSRDREERDPATSHNCFVQAYQQLRTKDSMVFRCITSSDRVFMTSFVNESGIDAGGVYREAMSRIVEDLFCEHFNLLVLCPNAQQQVHSNMDKYIPNPQHAGSKLAREMFEFMGRLMALSVRTKLYLPFEFPPIIWKKIVGEEVGVEDFMSMDAIACKQVESVRAWDIEKVEPAKLRFAYQGSDKVERELFPGDKNRPVTYDNRLEYCDAVTTARLNEFNEAAAGIARGMAEVIPSRALWLFSASQLETLVCGSPVFDLDLWKRKTDSTGVSARTVELFWKVMETLTQKELAGFVRFAWGRSRLPAAKEFTTKMRLTHGGTAPLPVSHTCFFSVELPEYGTEEEMRHGLLTAIHYGVGGILNG